MKIVSQKISLAELKKMAAAFGSLVKIVVDVQKQIMCLDGDLHADEENLLLNHGSKQENLWGINFYPNLPTKNQIEFDSMINLRPRQNNFSRGVDDQKVRKKILAIAQKLVKK